MSDYQIGKLIKGLRKSKNVSQKQLYYGLKKQNEVYKIEKGNTDLPKLQADILFERLGLSTDIYGYVFSIKEYELFQLRADLLEALEKAKYNEVEKILLEYESHLTIEDKYQKQFIGTIKLIMEIEKDVEPEYLLQEVEEILCLTVPEFAVDNLDTFLLSGIERTLVAIWAELLCRTSGKEETGMKLYYDLLFYMERNCTDLWEQEKQIPPIILLMVRWFWKWKQYTSMWICYNGIKILRKSMKLTLLEPLMKYEMKAWETGKVTVPEGESLEEWENGLKALEEIRNEYQIEATYKEDNICLLFALMLRQNFRGQILGESIRRIRKEKGITIEKLADGICEAETLRRIEVGEAKPHQQTYGKLMRKLGQEEYAYHPLIYSDDYRMYECYQKILWYMNRFEYERAAYELKKLEKGINNKNKLNYQVILKFQAILKEKMSLINKEEKIIYLRKALELTLPEEIEIENWPLRREELVIWNNIAIALEEMGERKKALAVLKKEKEFYEQRNTNLINNKKEYAMILRNYMIFLGRENMHKEVIEMADMVIRLNLEWGQGYFLTECLYAKIWNTEKLLEKNDRNTKKDIEKSCFPMLKQDFLIATIMQYTLHKHYIENHCKEYYGVCFEELL